MSQQNSPARSTSTEAAAEAAAPEGDQVTRPLNREQRRALKKGRKLGNAQGRKGIVPGKSKVRNQVPQGAVGKFTLPSSSRS
ncbi:hypothetical protein [Salininema proteolyticum]|uniref:Uncharacterized protein n=1 Tax=Salininema proteolyticum TaxID=1607685 RepID=A0ABV8U0T6_9ACTN